jgi:polysaccharide export outer membrane protein
VKNKFLSIVASLCCLFGASVFAADENPTEYLIAAGDILDVSVWKEPELTREVPVRPDGGITFPLIGNVKAAGKTADQLRDEIASSLSKFMPDPAVSVTVKMFKGNVIYVIGKVNKPGEYPVGRYVDVMQAISLAGGLTVYADEDDIKVLRRTKDGTVTFNFDYNEVVNGENLEQNIILQPGDTVMVPE